jgi:uncharacterized protein
VTPKSRRDEIAGMRPDGTVRIRVTAAPEGGRANEAVLRLLRDALALPAGAVRLRAGASSREKWVEIDGVDEAMLAARLKAEGNPK